MEQFSITLSETQRDIFLKNIDGQINDLQSQINELNSLRKQLQINPKPRNTESKSKAVDLFNGSYGNVIHSDEYKRHWKWNEKIIYVLELGGKCLKSGEIVDLILRYEPELERHLIQPSITSSISQNVNKLYERYKEHGDYGDYCIGLKHWFEEDGNVKEDYRYLHGYADLM